MTWDTAWSISKLIGLIVVFIAAITTIAKIWSSTSKDSLIVHLQEELRLCREHTEQGDKDVRHYRDEMHAVRGECQGKIAAAEAGLEFARAKLKEVEIENARLLSRTDLSPILDGLTAFMLEHKKFSESQTAINAQILKELQLVSDRLGNGEIK